jgi:hypothetical protein
MLGERARAEVPVAVGSCWVVEAGFTCSLDEAPVRAEPPEKESLPGSCLDRRLLNLLKMDLRPLESPLDGDVG